LLRLESGSFKPWLGGITAEFVTFSPDGKSVAYVSFPEGILWRANLDGSNPVQLTSPPLYPKNPMRSPDGTEILFSNSSAASLRDWRIYTVGLPRGSLKLLVPENAEPDSDTA
jgi:Tol biopolymer transport system component